MSPGSALACIALYQSRHEASFIRKDENGYGRESE